MRVKGLRATGRRRLRRVGRRYASLYTKQLGPPFYINYFFLFLKKRDQEMKENILSRLERDPGYLTATVY